MYRGRVQAFQLPATSSAPTPSQTISSATVEGGAAAYDTATASSIETITDSADDAATKVTNVLAALVADTTWTANTAGYSAKSASAKMSLYAVARSSLKILIDIRAGSGNAVAIPVAQLKALRPDLPAGFSPTVVKVAENGGSVSIDTDAGEGFTAPLADDESTTVVMSGGGQAATLVVGMAGGLYSIKDTDVGNDDLLEDDGSGGKRTVDGGFLFRARRLVHLQGLQHLLRGVGIRRRRVLRAETRSSPRCSSSLPW